MTLSLGFYAAVLSASLSAPILAAEPGVSAEAPMPDRASAVASLVIPPLTMVELEIDEPLGSKLSKTGQVFALHLRKPVVLAGREVVPAGVAGQGEVIHAKEGGGSGAPGELVLAARYLDIGGRHLALRSLHLSNVGSDKIGTVNSLMVASAASPVPFSVIGFFITGGETTIAKGMIVAAKTAADFEVALAPPATTSQTSTPEQITGISGGD